MLDRIVALNGQLLDPCECHAGFLTVLSKTANEFTQGLEIIGSLYAQFRCQFRVGNTRIGKLVVERGINVRKIYTTKLTSKWTAFFVWPEFYFRICNIRGKAECKPTIVRPHKHEV